MKSLNVLCVSLLTMSLIWSGASHAHEPVLPRTSPSEQMVNDANRALRNQEIRQQQENRLQFEVNSLRDQQMRQQQFPRLTAPPAHQHCPPGSPGC